MSGFPIGATMIIVPLLGITGLAMYGNATHSSEDIASSRAVLEAVYQGKPIDTRDVVAAALQKLDKRMQTTDVIKALKACGQEPKVDDNGYRIMPSQDDLKKCGADLATGKFTKPQPK